MVVIKREQICLFKTRREGYQSISFLNKEKELIQGQRR
jgi:hypothetical protein